jgi:HlyD family secretion protein
MRGLLTSVFTLGAFAAGLSVSPTVDDCADGDSVSAVSPPAKRAIYANGVVEGRQRETSLRFELSGRLASIEVTEGDRVRKGDTLARLDPTTWSHELAKAEASLALVQAERERLLNGTRKETRAFARAQFHAAQARMGPATKRLDRGVQLQQSKSLSQQDLDDLQSIAEAAQAELEAATARADEVEAPAREDELRMADAKIALQEAQVKQARDTLQKTELKAPSDGLVLRVMGEPGELMPDLEKATITMVDTSEMRVRAFVEEMDALAVVQGQRAYVVADALPNERFPGTVLSCTPYMLPKKIVNNMPGERIDVKVREVVILLDNQDKLVIGLPVEAFLNIEE